MLEARDDCDVLPATIDAADSWLVVDGTVLALELHRGRFFDAVAELADRDQRIDEVDALDVSA